MPMPSRRNDLPRAAASYGWRRPRKAILRLRRLAGDKLICVSRRGGTFVLAAKPEFEQLAHNEFASDESDFNASPAISDDQIFLRSNRFLYCIEND